MPVADQRTLAKQLVAAGADVVVGGHAHRVQGAGRMGEALVGYGLGNFVWYGTSELSTQTGVLLVTVDGRRMLSYRWVPARIVDGVPRPLAGSARRSGRRVALAPRLHRPEAVNRGYTARRGPLAQLVEQGTLNPKVEGSNPSRPIAEDHLQVSPSPLFAMQQRTLGATSGAIQAPENATNRRGNSPAAAPASTLW